MSVQPGPFICNARAAQSEMLQVCLCQHLCSIIGILEKHKCTTDHHVHMLLQRYWRSCGKQLRPERPLWWRLLWT